MTEKVFIDTGYLIGLLCGRDQHSAEAKRIANSGTLENSKLVISEMVIAEFLNAFASRGEHLRKTALHWINDAISEPDLLEVVEQDHQLFANAKKLYSERMDKKCGLTDCASFLIMKDKNIQNVLAFDSDFDQEGFNTIRITD